MNGSSGKTKKELTDQGINYGTITTKVAVWISSCMVVIVAFYQICILLLI